MSKKASTRQKWGRGIVLISSMILAILLMMLVSAGYVLVGGKGDSVTAYQGRDAALEAAESGYRYALTQLQKDQSWRGDSGLTYPVNVTGEIVVKEDRGNVIGFVYDRLGRVSQFRIRFNYQNSGSPSDGLGATGTPLNTTFVSCNNLGKTSPANLYLADSVTFKVANSGKRGEASSGSCHLIVEGFGGNGMDGTSPSNPYPPAGRAGVYHEVVESVLGGTAVTNNDSSVYAGNAFNISCPGGRVEVKTPNAGAAPRARVLGSVGLLGGTKYKSKSGRMTEESSVIDTFAPSDLQGGVTVEHVGNATQYTYFPKTTWSFAAAQGGMGQNLQAGTYVWRNDGSLEYFNQEYDPLVGPPAAGTGLANAQSMLPAAMAFNSGSHSLTITDTVNVTSTLTAQGIHFVVDPTFYTTFLDRPHLDFAPASPSVSAIVRSTSGNVTFQGDAQGQGSLVANGTISLQGTSALEAKIDDNVALYARGDVVITSIPVPVANQLSSAFPAQPPSKKDDKQKNEEQEGDDKGPPKGTPPGLPVDLFGDWARGQDVRLRGSIFAQGNVTADIAGTFGVRGVVTAYGGDPEDVLNPNPGARQATLGAGLVNVTAENAMFVFDPLYGAPGGGGGTGPISLARITCNIYRR